DLRDDRPLPPGDEALTPGRRAIGQAIGQGGGARWCAAPLRFYWSWKVPTTLVPPGPGRSATVLSVLLEVAGMQKMAASLPLWTARSCTLPASTPLSWMHWVVGRPKAPACAWPWPLTGGFGGQKMPLDEVD